MKTAFLEEIMMGRTKRQKRNMKLFTAFIVIALLTIIYLMGSIYMGVMLIK